MNKEQFDTLPVQDRFNIVSTHLSFLHSAISSRIGILPVSATLAAALLVVATFNNSLIRIVNIIKASISVLLLIIPISLFLYNQDLKGAQKSHRKHLERLLGSLDIENGKALGKITTIFPDFFVILITVINIMFIYKIWCN